MPQTPRSEGEKKEKLPKTKAMPLAEQRDYADWVSKQPKGKPGDEGAQPPEAPEDQKDPREHGSKDAQEGPQ
jgi:hypothetical protein